MTQRTIYVAVVLTAAAILLPAASAFGERGMHRGEQMFTESDTNSDGKLSYEEFKAANEKRLEKRFSKLDDNQDGFIDQTEMKLAAERRRSRRGQMRGQMDDRRRGDYRD